MTLNLVHNGQQFTESQSESPKRITVLKLQSQSVLQLRDQDALAVRASSLMPVRRQFGQIYIIRYLSRIQSITFLSVSQSTSERD